MTKTQKAFEELQKLTLAAHDAEMLAGAAKAAKTRADEAYTQAMMASGAATDAKWQAAIRLSQANDRRRPAARA